MCHIDALVINDSEGLFQDPKRNDITGGLGHTFCYLRRLALPISKNNSQSATILISYITRLIPLLPAMGNLSQEKGAYILGWVTGIVGTLILLVGLINFFHFLIGSFLNRTKEYAIMKMLGAD